MGQLGAIGLHRLRHLQRIAALPGQDGIQLEDPVGIGHHLLRLHQLFLGEVGGALHTVGAVQVPLFRHIGPGYLLDLGGDALQQEAQRHQGQGQQQGPEVWQLSSSHLLSPLSPVVPPRRALTKP